MVKRLESIDKRIEARLARAPMPVYLTWCLFALAINGVIAVVEEIKWMLRPS